MRVRDLPDQHIAHPPIQLQWLSLLSQVESFARQNLVLWHKRTPSRLDQSSMVMGTMEENKPIDRMCCL